MSRYDYYNQNKKAKLFSWKTFAKIVSIILASFVGAFGVLVLGLYLAGSFEKGNVPPDGIKFELQEAEKSKIQLINGKEYYVPDLIEKEGNNTFSLLIENAYLNWDEEKDAGKNKPVADIVALSVEIDDERVLKFTGEKAELNSPLEFTAVKDKNGYIVGGFASIKIRSGDGVYGQTSIDVFIDSPVKKVENSLTFGNTIQKEEDGTIYNVLCVGDAIAVNKPIYTPAQSSNPTIKGDTQVALSPDKLFDYKVEFKDYKLGGGYKWENIDGTSIGEVNKILKWEDSANKTSLKMLKTGHFRVSCSTYVTYNDQNKLDEEAQRVQSEYSYFKIENVSYSSINLGLKNHVFTYAMQYAVAGQTGYKKVESPSDLQTFRVYLNSRKSQTELNRINAINLNVQLNVPAGYNQTRDLTNALRSVYLTYNAETMSDSYQIIADTARSSGVKLYPLSVIERYPRPNSTEFDSVEEFYFELKLTDRNPRNVEFKFNIESAGVGSAILTDTAIFSMKENQSEISYFIPENTATGYGNYLGMTIRNEVIDFKEVINMRLRVDTTLEGENAHYVDLNKLTKNTPLIANTVPSYWKVKHYLGLGENAQIAQANIVDYVDKINNLSTEGITKLTGNLYGVEILEGKFMPTAYASYNLYAVLIQTDANGEEVENVINQTYTYAISKQMVADVQVQLNAVKVTLLNLEGEDISLDERLDEGESYYVKIEPDVIQEGQEIDILENYYASLTIVAVDEDNTGKEIPVSIGAVQFYNTGAFNGYCSLITIENTGNDKARNIRFYVRYTSVDDSNNRTEEEFGYSEQVYQLRDTRVRSVTFVPSMKSVTLTAQWNNDRVDWFRDNVVLINGDKLRLDVVVVGENTALSISSNDNTSSISIQQENQNYYVVISQIVDASQIITITAASVENPTIYDTMTLSLVTPRIVFGINESNTEFSNAMVDTSTNEVKRKGEGSIYSHVVHNGEEIDLRGTELAAGGYSNGVITAVLSGSSTHVEGMLNFSFEQETDYATIEGSVIRFNKNPANAQQITVLVRAFSSVLKFYFLLENNIAVNYNTEMLTALFANNNADNQFVMSFYNNKYYPTVMWSKTKQNKINFNNSLINITTLNGAAVPAMEFKSSWESLISGINDGEDIGKILTNIQATHLEAPKEVMINIKEKLGGGKQISIPILIVPNILIKKDVISSPIFLTIDDNYNIRGANALGENTITIASGNVFKPGEYIFSENETATINLQNSNDANIKLIKSNSTDTDLSIFTLRDFAGNILTTTGTSLLNELGAQDAQFGFSKIGLTPQVAYNGMQMSGETNSEARLQIETQKILCKKTFDVHMAISFPWSNPIETKISVIINPYFEIQLNTKAQESDDDTEVDKAVARANQPIYQQVVANSVFNNLPRMVLFNNQTMRLMDVFKIANIENGSVEYAQYFNNFSYVLVDNPDNVFRIQDQSSPLNATLKAAKFSANKFAQLGINYAGTDTGYRCVIFVMPDADIFANENNGLIESAVEDLVDNTKTINVGSVSQTENVPEVTSTTRFSLNSMFSLPTLNGSGTGASLVFSVGNPDVARGVMIGNDPARTITFPETTKDVIVKIIIDARQKYLAYSTLINEATGEEIGFIQEDLVWVRYFKLKASQAIDISYPYDNSSRNVFKDYYEESEWDKIKTEANGYIRLKSGDALNLGGNENDIVYAYKTNTTTHQSIWDTLNFEVQEYNESTAMWEASNRYSITDKINTISGSFTRDIFTRIHITNAGGADTYVNVLLCRSADCLPNLEINYPTQTTRTYITDGKQYEYRNKAKVYKSNEEDDEYEDIISLVAYDMNLNIQRILLGNESQTRERLYFETMITQINSLNEIEIGVNAEIDEDFNLIVSSTGEYNPNNNFVVRVFIRTDYGYYMQNGERLTYNFYYGENLTVELNGAVMDENPTDGVHKTIVLEGEASESLDVKSLFTVIAIDGAVPPITPSNFSIENENTRYLIKHTDDKWYISEDQTYQVGTDVVFPYNGTATSISYGGETIALTSYNSNPNLKSFTYSFTNYSVTVSGENLIMELFNENLPADGVKITITLTIKDTDNTTILATKDCVIRILPSVATISNNGENEGVNSTNNSAVFACGENGNIFTITDINTKLNATGLPTGCTFSAESQEFTITQTGNTFTFNLELNNAILEPTATPYVVYFNVQKNNITLRRIPYYISVVPTYKLEMQIGTNAQQNSNGEYFVNAYSGTKYDLVYSSNPLYFSLFQTTSKDAYTQIADYSNIGITFKIFIGGEWVNMEIVGNEVSYNSRVYGILKNQTFESRISADSYTIKAIARISGQESEIVGYSCQEMIINFMPNVLPQNVTVENLNTAITPLNPLIMDSDGLNLLDYLTIDLQNSGNLSQIYFNGATFSWLKLLNLMTYSSTTFANGENPANIILLDVVTGIMTKNPAYFTAKTTVQSITLYLYGVELTTIYVSIPRDYAYTFSTTFSQMYACDTLDLNLLATTFVGQSGNVLRGGQIEYKLVSTSAGAITDFDINNNKLTVTSNQNLKRDLTLLAVYKVGEGANTTYQTAKTVINIEPEYGLSIGENVYYAKANLTADDVYLTYGGVRQNIELNASNHSIIDKNVKVGEADPVGAGAEFNPVTAHKVTSNDLNAYSLFINNQITSTSNSANKLGVIYSPRPQTENLVSGLDVNLLDFFGEFYVGESPITNIANSDLKFYEIDYSSSGALFKLCDSHLLRTIPNAKEQDIQILVKAGNINYAKGTEIFGGTIFGHFTLKLYPAINLNASYTHNAQGLSVFKALQEYDLNARVIPNSPKAEFRQLIGNGVQTYDVTLFDVGGNNVTTNLSDYYSIFSTIQIGGNTKYIVSNDNKIYLSDTPNYDAEASASNILIENYNGKNVLEYQSILYTVSHKIMFTERAIGYSAVVTSKYTNGTNFANTTDLVVDYFIKVDTMELSLTPNENVLLQEGDTIDYTTFVQEDAKANGAISITFTPIGNYYETEQEENSKNATITNTSNLYDVKVAILITFTFANKNFIYTAEFTLKSTIKVDNIDQNGQKQKQFEFVKNDTSIKLTDKFTCEKVENESLYANHLKSISVKTGSTMLNYNVVFGEGNNNSINPVNNQSTDAYTLEFGDNNNIYFIPTQSIDVNTTFEITFVFMSGENQRKQVQIKLIKVSSTNALSVNQSSIEINAGGTYSLNSLTFQLSGADVEKHFSPVTNIADSVHQDKVFFDVSDDNLISINESGILSARPMVTDSGDSIKAYIFASYAKTENNQFYSLRIPVNITPFMTEAITASTSGYALVDEDKISGLTPVKTYKLIERLPNGTTNEETSTGYSGTLLEKYFNVNSGTNTITPKTTFVNAVELYLYSTYTFGDFKTTNDGQKFVLSKRIAIAPTTPILKVDGNTINKESGAYVYDLTAGQTKAINVQYSGGNASVELKFFDNENQNLTFGNNVSTAPTITNKNDKQNWFCPIYVEATSPAGDYYQFVLNVIVSNKSYSVNDTNDITGTLNAGENLDFTEYTKWYKVIGGAVTEQETATNPIVDPTADFYLGFKLNEIGETIAGQVDVFSVQQVFDFSLVELGTNLLNIGTNNQINIPNNFDSEYQIRVMHNGTDVTSSATITYLNSSSNIEYNSSNKTLRFVNGSTWQGSGYSFSITAEYGELTIERTYSIEYTNAYDGGAVDIDLGTYTIGYNNGVEYQGYYNIMDNGYKCVIFGVSVLGNEIQYELELDSISDINVSGTDATGCSVQKSTGAGVETNYYPQARFTKVGSNITGIEYSTLTITFTAHFEGTVTGLTKREKTVKVKVARTGIQTSSFGAGAIIANEVNPNFNEIMQFKPTPNSGDGILSSVEVLGSNWDSEFRSKNTIHTYLIKEIKMLGSTFVPNKENEISDSESEIREIAGIQQSITLTRTIYQYEEYSGKSGIGFACVTIKKLTNDTADGVLYNGGNGQTMDVYIPIQVTSGTKAGMTNAIRGNAGGSSTATISTQSSSNNEDNIKSINHISLVKESSETQTDKEFISIKYGISEGQIGVSGTQYTFTKDYISYFISIKKINKNNSEESNQICLVGDTILSISNYETRKQKISLYYSFNDSIFNYLVKVNTQTETYVNKSTSQAQAGVSAEANATNTITYAEGINSFSSSQDADNKNVETSISSYIAIRGVVTAYQSEQINAVFSREDEANVNYAGVSLSTDDTPIIASGSVLTFGSGANENTPYKVTINGETAWLIALPASPTSTNYTEPKVNKVVDSGDIIEFTETNIGKLVQTSGSTETILLDEDSNVNINVSLVFTSLNDNVLVPVANASGYRFNALFVLENTIVTMQVALYNGSVGPYIFSFNVEVLAQMEIEMPPSIDCEVGTTLNLNEIYSVKESNVEIDFAQRGGTVKFYYTTESEERTALETGFLDSSIINANAGKLIQLEAEFELNGKTITKTIGITVREELFELNTIQDVLTLYSGQSLDLNSLNLKLSTPEGYSLGNYGNNISITNAGECLTHSGTTITAMNVFEDVQTSVELKLIIGSKEYICAIDVYILASFSTADEINLDNIYVNTEYNLEWIKGILDIENHLGEKITNLDDYFTFAFENGNSFEYGYADFNPYRDENIVEKLNIYHAGTLVKVVNLNIKNLKADRVLIKDVNASQVITTDSNEFDLMSLFNDILKYENSTGTIVSANANWLEFSLDKAYAGISIVAQQEEIITGYQLINENPAPFLNMYDEVKVIVKDKNTEENYTITIRIKREQNSN